MNKLNRMQLFSILLLSGAWTVVCTPEIGSTGQMVGAVLACGLQMLLCIPLLCTDVDAEQLLYRQKWLGYLYAVYFLVWGAFGFTQLRHAAPQQIFTMPGVGVAAVLIVATCLYTSTAGLKATARCAPLTAALLAISVIVLLVGAWKRAVPDRLSLRTDGMFAGLFSYFAGGGELAAAWILLSRAQKGSKKSILVYLPVRLGFYLLLFALCITGGRLTTMQAYPFMTLTALSQPLQSQRADALYILTFVMLFVMHITVLTGVAAHILAQVQPKLQKSAPVLLLLMLMLSYLLPSDTLRLTAAVAMPVLVGVVPLTARLFRHRKKEGTALA